MSVSAFGSGWGVLAHGLEKDPEVTFNRFKEMHKEQCRTPEPAWHKIFWSWSGIIRGCRRSLYTTLQGDSQSQRQSQSTKVESLSKRHIPVFPFRHRLQTHIKQVDNLSLHRVEDLPKKNKGWNSMVLSSPAFLSHSLCPSFTRDTLNSHRTASTEP